MRLLFPILLLAFLTAVPSGKAGAASSEKKITLEELDAGKFELDELVPLPGKSVDDRAHRTIISGYFVTSFRANDRGVDERSGNEMTFGLDPADTSDFAFNKIEVGFTKRFSDLLWIAASFEIKQENEGGTVVTETELSNGEVHLVAPFGNGIDFLLGKFNSPVSFEPEDAPFLLQASHSLPFQFASPVKMTGLKINYPFQENLEVQAMIFNGWNQDGDNNEGKSLAFQVGYAPVPWADFKFSWLYGPELDNNETDFRQVFDLVASLTPWPNWIIGLEAAYGVDENQSARHPGTDAEWSTGQVTVHHDFTRHVGGTARYSFFDDRDGRPDFQNRQRRTLHQVSVGPTFHLTEAVLGFLGYGVIPKTRHAIAGVDLRMEYRYDWINESDANAFFEDVRGNRKSTRNMGIVELVATF